MIKSNPSTITLDSFVKLLTKTNGRDKTARLFQYFGLFASQFHADNKQLSTKWLSIHKTLRTSRKVLRILRSMQYSRRTIDTIKTLIYTSNINPIQKSILVFHALSSLFNVLFFVFDHRVLFAEIAVISKDNLQANTLKSWRFWFLKNIFALVRDILALVEFNLLGETGSKHSQQQILLDIVKCVFNALIALSRLNGGLLSKQSQGILGVVSSIIQIHQAWI